MNQKSMTLTVVIGLGGAIGWYAKPVSPSSVPGTSSSQGVSGSSASSRISSRRVGAQPARDQPSEASGGRVVEGGSLSPTDVPGNQERVYRDFRTALKNRRDAALNSRIAKLVSELNLKPAEAATLSQAVSDAKAELDQKGGYVEINTRGGRAAIEEAIASFLSQEKVEKYEALKGREFVNKAQSKALTELAGLSNLDLTQAQKAAVYDIFYGKAEKEFKGWTEVQIASDDSMNLTSSLLGIDPSGANTRTTIVFGGGQATGSSGASNGAAERDRQYQEERINAQVEELGDILTEEQAQLYRANLASRSSYVMSAGQGANE